MAIFNEIPTVVISNFAEAHIDFLGRSDKPSEAVDLINGEDYHGDRTILWAGDPKLVVVNYPIAHAGLNESRLDYSGTTHIAPKEPSHYLSLDILRERRLLDAVVEHSGPARVVRIIPYATTREFLRLVTVLRTDFGLNVITPESPDVEHFWIRDYIDSKTGFRSLASFWLPNADKILPFGIVCNDLKHAAEVAYWFTTKGEACVVKADTGESGIGITVITPEPGLTMEAVYNKIQLDPFYADEPIVVERFIPSSQRISPSLEVVVPQQGSGEPKITYISKQLFLGFGDFCGIQVDRTIYDQTWCDDLVSAGLEIANKLQVMGYVGHFDVDCIVSDDNKLYLLEVNARRTGGTHVHEFAKHIFGDDYINQVSLISFEAASSGVITDPEQLIQVLGDYLYPMAGDEPLGVVVTITNALFKNRFGYVIVAPTEKQAVALQENLNERIRSYSG